MEDESHDMRVNRTHLILILQEEHTTHYLLFCDFNFASLNA